MITTNGAGEQPQDQGGTSSKNAASPVTLVTADQIDAIVRGARPIRFCDSAAIKPDSITIGKPDCHEEIVTRLYHRRHHYAVYLTEPPGKPDDGKAPGKPDEGKRPVRNRLNRLLLGWSTYFGYGTRLQAYRAVQKIRVTYSVDKEQADKQIKHTIGLGPRRIHIMNLVDQDHVPEKCKHTYFEQIAEALKVGLEEEISTAEKILDEVKSDVLGVLARISHTNFA
jgi:hypothetical protein